MQCPKCKNKIDDNILRCPNCNLMVRIVCPQCKTISPMGKKFCAECGFKFFVSCPSCNTVNLYSAQSCRKCGNSLGKKDVDMVEIPIEEVLTQPDSDEIESKPEIAENTPVENNIEFSENDIEEEVEESNINDNLSVDEEGFFASSDEFEVSESQLNDIISKVDEIDKSEEKKAEAEALIQKKFEQQEELSQEKEEDIPPEYVQLNQTDAQTAIIEAIQNPIKRIISLSGKEGHGKTLILKYVFETLRKNENYICALGECSALTQITPFGYIQDVLLNICNLSNFSINIDDFVKNNTRALEAKFFNLNPQEINDLFNFIYPFKKADFNGILKRKEYTINILKKVVENLAIKSTVVFIIDDFENIDGASYDFIKDIISDEKFNEKVKILITNKYNKIAQAYFYDKELKPNNYSNIFLSGLDKEQCISLINTLYGQYIDMPDFVKNQICENSKGTSAYVEQACQLLGEIGAINVNEDRQFSFNPEFNEYILPNNTYRILEERINNLENNVPVVAQSLYYASILGNKFSIHQFENVLQFLNVKKDDFVKICEYLISQNYICQISDNYFTFRNTSIWHYIYEKAKANDSFVEFNKNIYTSVESLTLSNNSLKPLLLQNCDDKKAAYEYWIVNAELASYLGDTNLYVISLKQQLKLTNDIPCLISPQQKIHIYEQMGKILYKLSSKEAINYLSAAIAYYKDENNYNPVRVVELSAFLVKACKKTGDFLGIIEACDVALSVLQDKEYNVEKALITSKKLNALLSLGNCEEVINLSNTELISTIEDALAKSNVSKIIPDYQIFDIWFDTSINLAGAYAIQGDKKVFDVVSKIDDALLQNHVSDEKKSRRLLLVKALAYTMRGEVKLSSDVLSTITTRYSTDEMEENYVLRWNFINIINKIISKDYKNLIEEMFQVTTFADNINDSFIKNILKLLLGYIIQSKSQNTGKALEIYNEEIVYFSKEKIATGALLSWFLIANVSRVTQGVDYALDIALKALDVAKGPKINNLLFIIALKLLIADMYMIKGDFEAVRMYLEKALLISRNNDLRFMQMLLYQSFAKYYSEMINVYKDNALEYAQKAADMYKSAINAAQNMLLNVYEANYKKELTSFKVSCQLKNIIINVED